MGTMIQGTSRSWSTHSVSLAGLALCSSLAACVIQEAPKRAPLNTTDDDKASVEQPTTTTDPLEPETNSDSGAFGKPGSSSGSSGNFTEKLYCQGTVRSGDLQIVELMIASKSGSGDSGEWVEIKSTRDCWMNLTNVVVASPRGTSGTDAVTLGDVDVAPGGTFLVANTADSTKNNGLKGAVYAWDATDVLKNDGDTVTVKLGDLVIDTLTYPSLAAARSGNSVAFPADCASADRGDWLKWSASTQPFGALKATPNAPNDDVACK